MSALFYSRNRNRGRASLRMLGIAMTVFLVLTVLTPLVQNAGAEEAPPITDSELVDEVIQEETPAAEQEGEGEGTGEEETGDQQLLLVDDVPEAPVRFYIDKYECDSDYGHDIYQLQDNCYAPTVEFQFEVNGPEYSQPFVNSFGADNLHDGVYSFYEYIPEGYAEPIVFCQTIDPTGLVSGLVEVVTYDGAYETQIDPGYTLYCSWYNIKDDHRGVVTVIKYECPDVLSPDTNFGDYQYECWQPQADVDFKLDGASTGNPGNYLTDAEGTVSWGDREADHYYLTETLPEGYGTPVVYCDTYFPFDEQLPEYLPYSVSADGQIEFDLEAGQHITCYWFNIPEHDEYGIVTVIKYECLEAPDWEANYEVYQQSCNQPQEGVDFKLDGAATGNPGNYLTDAAGRVVWDEREADHYYLTETVPAGYGTPVVYCHIFVPGDGQVPTYFGYEISAEGQIEFDLEAGESIICYWFNVPGHDDGGITIIKHTCPQFEGVIEGAYEYLLGSCPEVTDGIPFSLELLGNDYLEWSTTGDYEPGTAYFDGLGAGEYRLDEDKPEGYGKPLVFCQRYVEDGGGVTEFSPYDVDEFDAIGFELGQYEGIVCHWFNFPEDEDGTVTVYKYICDEEAALDGDLGYYQEKCTEVHQDVPFNLDGESTGDQGTLETDADGKVFWDELDTDLYTLDEEIPSGYGEPVVFCGFSAYYDGAVYDGFPVRYEDVYDGAVELDFQIPTSDFFCWYFNIPEYDTSITIYKWLCPENFDLYDSAKTHCTEPLNGVEFTIDGPDGYHSESFTGDSIPYAVHFGGLEEGYYEVYETLPPGIDYGFIAECSGNSNPWPAVYPLYHTAWSDAFSIEIAKGDHVTCHWYNVPEHKEDGKLTVVKYLCAGYVISDLNCSIYKGGQAFTLTPAEGGAPYEFTTGADGTKSLSLPEGAWILDEVGDEWCKAKSPDINGYGQIVTTDGHESIVYIYNCAPPSKTPPVKQPPIKEFPNTGSGPMSLDSGLSGSDLAGQAMILLLVAQGLVLVALRRGGALRLGRRTS